MVLPTHDLDQATTPKKFVRGLVKSVGHEIWQWKSHQKMRKKHALSTVYFP